MSATVTPTSVPAIAGAESAALSAASDTTSSLSRSYDPFVRGPVLLATDGRSATDATLHCARAIAERLGTTVEVVGVVEPLSGYLTGTPEVPMLPIMPDLEEVRRAALRASIAERLEEVGGASRWPVLIAEGEPAHTIADVARERDSSVIVVGAGHAAGGERAARVVRAADRPVVVVPAELRTLPKTIVAGVDFSPASVRAARVALAILADGGRLVLVHVRAPIDFPALPTSMLGDRAFDVMIAHWREQAMSDEARLLERLLDELRPYTPPTVIIDTRTRSGNVPAQLRAVADELGAEMLAVGTHGPGFVERFFVGSVAASAVRTAAGRAVLVAPAPSALEAARIELRLRGTMAIRKSVEWEPALDAFSRRNVGRRVRLEVDDPDLGAQVQQTGLALLGVSYDRHDRRIEIMMGDPGNLSRHLTSTISHVDDVAFYAGPDGGRERALCVERGRGQALLTFLD